jgi:hypothetical protein
VDVGARCATLRRVVGAGRGALRARQGGEGIA